MGFLAATAGRAVAATVGVLTSTHAEYLAITKPVADANPRAFRWAIWLLLSLGGAGLLVFAYWLIPETLKPTNAEGMRTYGFITLGLIGLPLAVWLPITAKGIPVNRI